MQKYAIRGDDSIGKNVPCTAAPPQETAAQTRADVAKYNALRISTRGAPHPGDHPPGDFLESRESCAYKIMGWLASGR
jgi:hypothetical protein